MKTTHKQLIKRDIQNTSEKIIQCLALSNDEYIELRYELAYMWMYNSGMDETTARFFILSPTFHNWWQQKLAMVERFILKASERKKAPELRCLYRDHVKNISVYPSSGVLNTILDQGREAIKNNNELGKIRIYGNKK